MPVCWNMILLNAVGAVANKGLCWTSATGSTPQIRSGSCGITPANEQLCAAQQPFSASELQLTKYGIPGARPGFPRWTWHWCSLRCGVLKKCLVCTGASRRHERPGELVFCVTGEKAATLHPPKAHRFWPRRCKQRERERERENEVGPAFGYFPNATKTWLALVVKQTAWACRCPRAFPWEWSANHRWRPSSSWCSDWHLKLLQGFHGMHCRQLQTSAGSAVNSCTHSATGSLCSVYAWFHWKMDIPGKDNCYRRIILPTGRYDQKHTDPITDRPIVTRRRRQKPACLLYPLV